MPRWSVYLVRCSDGALYTGIATDVARRLAEHRRNRGRGAKYLRGRLPLRLVLERAIGSRRVALRIEARIKTLPRREKEALIARVDVLDRLVRRARRGAARRRQGLSAHPAAPS